MKWIKHDTDANLDAKLQNVMLDYGLEGYGLYWYCIELIAGNVSKENITFELEHDARIIARNTGSTAQKVEEMMRYFVNIGLFENSQGTISCLKLAKRLDKSMTSNPEMRAIIEQLKSHDGVMIKSSKGHDGVMQDQTRSDQTRQEEKRTNKKQEPKRKRFTPPDPDEVQQYMLEYENKKGLSGVVTQFLGERFVNHYQSVDWVAGKKKMTDWKSAARNWVLSNNGKQGQKNKQSNADPQSKANYQEKHSESFEDLFGGENE